LKYDWCSTNRQQTQESYVLMRDALKLAGRPIVLSLCEWGNSKPWTWAPNVGHLWRTTTDIVEQWEGRRPRNGAGILTLAEMQAVLYSYAGPGDRNDPDMLEVGNGGMSNAEYRSHFSLWAIMAAPPIAGNELDMMTPETSAILLNKDVITVDQDALGTHRKRVRHENDQDIWVKSLQNGAIAVVMLNRGAAERTITLNWADLSAPPEKSFAVRDLWEHKGLGQMSGKFRPSPIASHGTETITLKS
jgi:alpha-galactosidase